ncbi:MAG: VOC family protein [Pseudomonadota bacterium]
MIFANLMVTNVVTSAQFYMDVLGVELSFFVDADHQTQMDAAGKDIILASLTLSGAQLMLQRSDSLSEELPSFAGHSPNFTGTIYFRDLSVDAIRAQLSDSQIIKEPFTQWYGMRELYFKDPDGYVICVGEMDGPSPA